jgi:hypothetical protein
VEEVTQPHQGHREAAVARVAQVVLLAAATLLRAAIEGADKSSLSV